MKRILSLLALLVMFIAVMPANTGPVDTDVGISYVIAQGEQPTQDIAIMDMTFISVINPGESDVSRPMVKPEAVLLPVPRATLHDDPFTYHLNTGPPILRMAKLVPGTGSHSSGGISY